MTHCTSVIVAWRSACSAGNATLTTVASMKDMLDPMMVAASVQRRDDGIRDYVPVRTRMARRLCFISWNVLFHDEPRRPQSARTCSDCQVASSYGLTPRQ